jgi:hypothetical protein
VNSLALRKDVRVLFVRCLLLGEPLQRSALFRGSDIDLKMSETLLFEDTARLYRKVYALCTAVNFDL